MSLKKILDINDGHKFNFDKKNVRALVEIDNEIYFIDSNGVVSINDSASTYIDKYKFRELIGEGQ
jgi:hypothetical protein